MAARVDAGRPRRAPRRSAGSLAEGGQRVLKAPRTLHLENAAFGLLAGILLLGAPVAARLFGLH